MNSISGSKGILDFVSVNQMSVNLINNQDTNGDGVLTSNEAGSFKDVFSQIDVNGDSQIDKTELNVSRFASGQLNQMTNNLITSKDQNGDSVLSAEEMGLSSNIFAIIDTNGDGQANKDELNAAYVANKHLDQMTNGLIMGKDQNADSVLTAEEIGVSSNTFTTIDTDSSGVLNKSELNAAFLGAITALNASYFPNISNNIDITL